MSDDSGWGVVAFFINIIAWPIVIFETLTLANMYQSLKLEYYIFRIIAYMIFTGQIVI